MLDLFERDNLTLHGTTIDKYGRDIPNEEGIKFKGRIEPSTKRIRTSSGETEITVSAELLTSYQQLSKNQTIKHNNIEYKIEKIDPINEGLFQGLRVWLV